IVALRNVQAIWNEYSIGCAISAFHLTPFPGERISPLRNGCQLALNSIYLFNWIEIYVASAPIQRSKALHPKFRSSEKVRHGLHFRISRALHAGYVPGHDRKASGEVADRVDWFP